MVFSRAVGINGSCLSIPFECPEKLKSLGKNCKVAHCAVAVVNVGITQEEMTGNTVMQILLGCVPFLVQAGDPAMLPNLTAFNDIPIGIGFLGLICEQGDTL